MTDLNDLKRSLPVDYVLAAYGHTPDREESSAVLYHVPWRRDGHASLAVFSRDSEIFDRWADRAGPDGGDVFDLIQMLDDCGTGQAIARAQELEAAHQFDTEYTGPDVPERVVTSVHEMEDHVNRAKLAAEPASLEQFVNDRGAPFSARWLTETFQVTAADRTVTMPYLDTDGSLLFYRYRRFDGKPMSVAGSSITAAYGYHRYDPTKPVIIVEGESDTWHGTWHLGDRFNILGIPGASMPPDRMDIPVDDGHPLYLCFDGDRAGRDASKMWANWAISQGLDVFILPMPEGKDLSDVRNPAAVVADARRIEPVLHGIGEIDGRYVRLSTDGTPGRELSDFTAEVLRTVDTPDGRVYEVEIYGKTEIVKPWDLLNARAFRTWALQHDHIWLGQDADVGLMLSSWKADSLFTSSVSGTSVAGLHDGSFIWPGGSTGDGGVRFVPGVTSGFEREDFSISPTPSRARAAEAVRGFLELYPLNVTTPMLAWLAAAPLRATAPTFPYLSVSGEYGTGKSAFLEKYIPAITGCSRVLALGSGPTRYAMTSLLAAGNAFPVMFDEFRTNGSLSNASTIADVENLIRATWNAGTRETGGHPMDGKRMIKLQMEAPLVVAGEIEQNEGSTRERMVPIYLIKALQGDESRIMSAIDSDNGSSFAALYLDFLLHSPIDGSAAKLTERYSGAESLDNRMRITAGYLEQGWELLQDFMAAIGRPIDDVELDLSYVFASFEETQSSPPLATALIEVLTSTNRLNPAVWEEDGVVYIKTGQFSKEAAQLGFVTGGPATVGKSLTTLFDATSERPKKDGQRVYVRAIRADQLGLLD